LRAIFLLVPMLPVVLVSCAQFNAASPLPSQQHLPSAKTVGMLGKAGQQSEDQALTGYVRVYRFKGGANGRQPIAALLADNGEFYGTTSAGGNYECSGSGCGTIFTFNPSSRAQKVVYAFKGPGDGYDPQSALVDVNGELYGTTTESVAKSGCGSGCGTIFAFDPSSYSKRIVYEFKGGNDGVLPNGLNAHHGRIYGTTRYGGGNGCIYSYGCGTLFVLNPSTGEEKVLYRFKGGKDGANPWARLMAYGNNLYGTTTEGGVNSYGYGTIFKYDLKSGVESVLYRFKDGKDGQFPRAGVIVYKGKLYGTTFESGGCYNTAICGTIFTFTLATGIEKVVHDFTGNLGGSDGAGPAADLVALNGKLYGTTLLGGKCRCGTIFDFDPSTNTESVLYRFKGVGDASFPNGLRALNGNLFGTAIDGVRGCYRGVDCGAIFEFTP